MTGRQQERAPSEDSADLVARAGSISVLYVGGMPRSGSTLTDMMLHQLPGNVGVGELHYLWRNCLQLDNLCACGEPFSRCEFWTAVGLKAFGGWDNVDPAEVLRLQSQVDTTRAIPLILLPRRPRAFQQSLDAYCSILLQLYRAILDVSGEQVVVDSSKRASLAFVLATMSDIDVRAVQVVRDPRGVAYSFGKHVALEPGVGSGDEMPRSTARKVARRWVTVNALIAGLPRRGVPTTRIRYEDLVADPMAQLRRIMALQGHDPGAEDLGFVTVDGVSMRPSHLIAAGRIRLGSGTMALRLDEAWRTQMDRRSRRLVGALTTFTRLRYGYR
ncbi:MAG: sulfotransferase [Nocardioidaceae bacterium]